MASKEDDLRATIAEQTSYSNQIEAQLRTAQDKLLKVEAEAREWQAKYIDSGKWRKYAPTAIVAALVGFGVGLLL